MTLLTRSLILAPFFLTLAVPAALAGDKQVEIVNEEPLAIEIAPVETGVVQFLGATSVKVAASIGANLTRRNEQCDEEYPGSHWCTTEEMSRSRVPSLDDCESGPTSADAGWVRPVLETAGVIPGPPGLGRPVLVDKTTGRSNLRAFGDYLSGNLMCTSNTRAGESSYGLVMTCSGRVFLDQCTDFRPLNCCGVPPTNTP